MFLPAKKRKLLESDALPQSTEQGATNSFGLRSSDGALIAPPLLDEVSNHVASSALVEARDRAADLYRASPLAFESIAGDEQLSLFESLIDSSSSSAPVTTTTTSTTTSIASNAPDAARIDALINECVRALLPLNDIVVLLDSKHCIAPDQTLARWATLDPSFIEAYERVQLLRTASSLFNELAKGLAESQLVRR